jgi:hypothetical protein
MKKVLTIVSVLATSLVFTACGGGGSTVGSSAGTGGNVSSGGSTTANQTAATSKVIPLHIGEATPVKAGYSIVESSEDAVLDILVVGETKTVTLKSGAASIKMPI